MSGSEFYHEALVRRIRDRDDCDDDLRGACDEIDDCYEAIGRLEGEIDRLRLTDKEREAIGVALQCVESSRCQKHPEEFAAAVVLIRTDATLRKLLERFAPIRSSSTPASWR